VTQTANFSQDALYSLRAKLSTRDAARFLGVSASMLAKLRISSGGPIFSKLGRRVVYDLVDLKNGQQVANSGTHLNVHRHRPKRREVPLPVPISTATKLGFYAHHVK
jgi:hypothetical protein